jgi:hypothetical protein
MFVNPEHVYPATTVEDVTLPPMIAAAPPSGSLAATAYDPSLSPTQVQLVDFLQSAASRRSRVPLPPIAVVVAAWDLVAGDGQRPDDWLKTRMPLLHQYLSSTSPSFPYAVFGVSAQGGQLPSAQNRLVKKDPVTKTLCVRSSGKTTADITEPITWLLEATR